MNVSLAEAYDSDAPEQLRSTLDPLNPQAGGFFTSLMAGCSFNWQGSRLQLGATGGSAFRYFGDLNEVRNISQTVGLGLGIRLTKRTSLLLNQSVAYSPSYLYGLFPRVVGLNPGDSPIAAPDYASSDLESYAYATVLGLTHGFNRRTSLSVTGELQSTNFLKETSIRNDVRSWGVRSNLSRNLTRNTALVAGYRYRTGDFGYGTAGTSTEHGLDIGVNYAKPLSATRRAEVGFKVGGSNLTAPPVAGDIAARLEEYRLLSAEASLSYEFRRTWQARAALRRGFEYVTELTDPVFTEGFSINLDGLLSSRVEFAAGVGYSKGQSALSRSSLAFDTYTGNARLRRRLTGSIAAYVEYLYYFYDFGGNTDLAPGLAPKLERHGARAGITLWVPVLRR